VSTLKKAIVMSFPGYEELYNIAKPSVELFARKHGYDIRTFTDNPYGREPSWAKVKRLIETFEAGYDVAFWLDADTVIVNPTQDIFVPEEMHQAVVEHRVDGTTAINLGVWYLKKEALPFLHEVWETGIVPASVYDWWEQNTVMQTLGIMPFHPYAKPQQSNPYLQKVFLLDYGWNVNPYDARNFGTHNLRILHAAGCGSVVRRADIMRRWVTQLCVDKLT
jgi:hypothetical protein